MVLCAAVFAAGTAAAGMRTDSASHGTLGTGGCATRTANHRLDFWLGDWIVYVGSGLDGTNHIVSILGGCAVEENWTDITGYQGRSWFYVDPSTGLLKQLWLSSHAEQPGGTLEKVELPGTNPGSVRFQGVRISDSGQKIMDRTTLTLEADGTVHEVMDTSKGRTHLGGGL